MRALCDSRRERAPQHTSVYVSIRQHTSAYVSIRQHTSAYASIRQHTSAYVCVRDRNLCDGRRETAPHTSRRRPLYTRRGPAQIGMSTSHILVYTAIDVSWYNCCICILAYTAIYEIGMSTTQILTYTATYVSSYISVSAVIYTPRHCERCEFVV